MIALWFASSLALAAPPVAPADAWETTLDRVSRAVVSIEVTGTRDFDTESASNSVGTGFIVDEARGILLTNRHMVHAGPVTARAVLLDNEEVRLEPIYRDPVHDFGFYRFDPAQIRYQDLEELVLAPDAAKVGMEIRVVGNDAGEKLSILDGTLARLDRNAPLYGRGTYNDFNTFYLQAASNTSGGSSGSPVVDVKGRVVALNAGGRTEAASSFYLPLPRVARAFELLRQGLPIPRGTLLTTFTWEAWQEVDRLGVADATEGAVRKAFPEHSGMLVVQRVLPKGPADGKLRPGDVLVRIDGRLVKDFVDLEGVLDDRVGGKVKLGLERLGSPIEVELDVADLHAVSPDSYLEVGRAVLHQLSYQVARSFDAPLGAVFVATPGWMFANAGIPSNAVITHVDGVAVPTLDGVQAELESKADLQRVRVRYAPIADPRSVKEAIVTLDRTWFPMRRCTRDDRTGRWPCVDAAAPPPLPPRAPVAVTVPPSGADKKVQAVAESLVLVEFDIPYSTAGMTGTSFRGTGVVVDAAKGLVVVDRDTVPVALGTLELTFAGTVRVPGEVLWVHPVHNLALVRYQPALLGDVPVREVAFDGRWVEKGDKVKVVALDRAGRLVVDDAEVEKVDTLVMEAAGTPRFRDIHLETITLARVERSVGGLVLDKRGRAVALWSSFYFPGGKESYFYGVPASYLIPMVAAWRADGPPEVRQPGMELRPRTLADARERGLSDERIRQYLTHDGERPEILEVVRTMGGAPASELLRPTDLIVLAEGKPVSRMRDVEAWSTRRLLSFTILRDGQEIELAVPTVQSDGDAVRKVVVWAGTILHAPHREVALDKGIAPKGAYIAWYWFGTPAARDGVRPTRRVVRIGDTPIEDLDGFVQTVRGLDPSKPVVLTMEDLDGATIVKAIELDPDYWPTEIIAWEEGAWRRTRLDP